MELRVYRVELRVTRNMEYVICVTLDGLGISDCYVCFVFFFLNKNIFSSYLMFILL